MKILSLDLGTKTGWAFSKDNNLKNVYSGTQEFSLKRGESPGMRFLRFDKWISDFFVTHNVDVVVYEMPHHRGGAATALLGGLVGILLKACATYFIEHTSVHSGTLKKFAIGKGKASKEDMIKRAEELFSKKVEDDNEADALLMWLWATKEL